MIEWKKLDLVEDPPAHLDDSDECYYARERTAYEGYDFSTANNLISNLQKPPAVRKTSQWRYKLRAIECFASELCAVVPRGATVIAIPTSKAADDPDYDPRLSLVLSALKRKRPDVYIEVPLVPKESSQALHEGGRRGPTPAYVRLKWVGFTRDPKSIVIIDDVITTGGSFKGCQRHIREHYPNAIVHGVFWARTVWKGNHGAD